MIVRSWLESDISSVAEIESRSFGDPWSEKSIEETFNTRNFFGVVACDDENEVIGYVGASSVIDEGEIYLVAVKEEYRRKGVASAMLDEIFSRFGNRGVKKVFLEVRKSNLPALHCYERAGFEKISVRKKYYEGIEDAVIMEKRL